ncbi:MAG: tetrahydrofolate synthase [Treponema sp.]|jgi:dihydrofolate synthase/folylpolyglutamate synthase|nr:tetrahydrofolate synthase [Treponema sp.]
MDGDGVYSWLCSFINLERGLGGVPSRNGLEEHFKLSRIRALADLAGNPERGAPVIHIAGSKGKGSVTAMIASILEEGGIKTARYMSPHVSDWRERISRGKGDPFPEEVYREAGRELVEVYNNYGASRGPGPNPPDPGEPTFFELLTLYFFLCARGDSRRFMVVETGLGGRLDATNIVDPLVSVITPIEKEHTGYLGETLEAIAGEKGGIIKRGRPVISAEQDPRVLGVLRRLAEERAAPFFYLPELTETGVTRIHPGGTDFTLTETAPPGFPGAGPRTLALSVPGPGAFQARNAALAIRAVQTALAVQDSPAAAPPGAGETAAPRRLDGETARRGLGAFSLPARFEKVRENPVLIIDGAHTPRSAELCAETFRGLYGGGGILLFGCAADKDAASMAAILVPGFSRIIVTAPGAFRASDPAGVYRAFQAAAGKGGNPPAAAPPELTLIPSAPAALEEALRLGGERALPILACGSFYLAAEIRKTPPRLLISKTNKRWY